MIIRKAQKKDAGKILELYLEFWKFHKDLSDFWLPKWAPNKIKKVGEVLHINGIQQKLYKDVLNSINSKNSMIFVAEKNKEVTGYIEFYIEKNRDWFKVKKYGFLEEICVSSDHRRKGIAKKLLSFAEKYLKKRKINYILLKTSLTNKLAQKTWESQDFKKEMILWVKRF